jgi:hypothetical protein
MVMDVELCGVAFFLVCVWVVSRTGEYLANRFVVPPASRLGERIAHRYVRWMRGSGPCPRCGSYPYEPCTPQDNEVP